MIPTSETAAFEWIVRQRTPTPHCGEVNAASGVNLSCVLPLTFEKYAKILHRLDGHYENIDHPLSAEEIDVLGIPDCSVIRELVMRKRNSSSSSRIFWREAAQALGVPYAPEINHTWFSTRLEPNPQCWPRFIWGPGEGSLDSCECHELVSKLATVTGEQGCYFKLAEIPYVGTEQDLLFTGSLGEMEDFFINSSFQFTPEYWWPRDHSWCVCTDYDLDFTVVGGSSILIDGLLQSDVLECIEVPPSIRVDSLVAIP